MKDVRFLLICALTLLGVALGIGYSLFHKTQPPINPRDSFYLSDEQLAQLADAATYGDSGAASQLGLYWFMYRNMPACAHTWLLLAERSGAAFGPDSALEHTRHANQGVPELQNCSAPTYPIRKQGGVTGSR